MKRGGVLTLAPEVQMYERDLGLDREHAAKREVAVALTQFRTMSQCSRRPLSWSTSTQAFGFFC